MRGEGHSVPVDRASAQFSADRRRLDGTRSFWATSETYSGVRLTRWDLTGDEATILTQVDAPSWLLAVQNDSELIAVRADEVTDYQAPDSVPLLELLVCTGAGHPTEVDWPFDVAEYESEDEAFTDSGGVVCRFARASGHRLYFAESDDEPVPFLVVDGEVDGQWLARYTEGLFNSPMSGLGRWDLVEVTPGMAVAVPSGDITEAGAIVRGFRFDPKPEDTARMIVNWMTYAEDGWGFIKAFTAIALEPLDPSGLLSHEARQAWQELFDSLKANGADTSYVESSLSAEVTSELRRLLRAESSIYAKVKDALGDPLEGDWLRQALADGDWEPLSQ